MLDKLMLDKEFSSGVLYQPADPDVFFESPKNPLIKPDSISTVKGYRTSSVSSPDTVAVSAPDTIVVSSPDTVAVSAPDTIVVSSPDTVTVSNSDSIGIPIPDSLSASSTDAPPDSLPVHSQDTKITGPVPAPLREEQQEKDVPAATGQIISGNTGLPKETENTYEDIFYFDSRAKDELPRDHIFPFPGKGNKEGCSGDEVFIQETPRGVNNSSVEYINYLESDIKETSRDNFHSSITWIPLLVILSLFLLTWIKVIYLQFLTPVLVSAFNYKEAKKLYIEKNAPAQNAFIILHFIFAINTGLFLLFVADYFGFLPPDIGPVFFFLGSSLFIILLFSFKFFGLTLIGYLFDYSKKFSEYKHNISLYNKIYGILLLPVIVGLLYIEEYAYSVFIYAGLILGIAFYLLQLIRGLEIIKNNGVSVFYLILYLCAFEILPILVLYKLFSVLLI